LKRIVGWSGLAHKSAAGRGEREYSVGVLVTAYIELREQHPRTLPRAAPYAVGRGALAVPRPQPALLARPPQPTHPPTHPTLSLALVLRTRTSALRNGLPRAAMAPWVDSATASALAAGAFESLARPSMARSALEGEDRPVSCQDKGGGVKLELGIIGGEGQTPDPSPHLRMWLLRIGPSGPGRAEPSCLPGRVNMALSPFGRAEPRGRCTREVGPARRSRTLPPPACTPRPLPSSQHHATITEWARRVPQTQTTHPVLTRPTPRLVRPHRNPPPTLAGTCSA
jgi:hypothetical protein